MSEDLPGAASWSSTTLGELCQGAEGGIQTGPFGSQIHAYDYVDRGIPSVMPQNIGENCISDFGIARISHADSERLVKYRLRAGDIVYSRRGDVEKRSLVRDENDGWLCGTGCLRVRLAEGSEHDPRFVSYLLGTPEARSWITRHAVGATMPNLNTAILSALPVRVPGPSVQRAIAEVLGALDDKIAANAKLAAISEGLLAARFDAMAIDVDPGDAGLRVPITRFVELNPSLSAPRTEKPTYVDMNKLPVAGWGITDWSCRPARGGARFENGDTLLARITPCLENRKTGFVDFLEAGEVGVGSTEFIVMRARTNVPRELPYFLAVSPRFREFAIRHMVGTSGRQRVGAKDLANFEISNPGAAALGRFGERSGPAFALIAALRDESRTLATTRDTLLPALMSGKLRVRDAERQLEEVL